MHQASQVPGGHPAAVATLDRKAAAAIDSALSAARRHGALDKTTAAVRLAEEFLSVRLDQGNLAATLAAFALQVARRPERSLATEVDIRTWPARWARVCERLAPRSGSGADFEKAVDAAIGAAKCFDGLDQSTATVLLGRYLAARVRHRWPLAFALAALAVHEARSSQVVDLVSPARKPAGILRLRAALRQAREGRSA